MLLALRQFEDNVHVHMHQDGFSLQLGRLKTVAPHRFFGCPIQTLDTTDYTDMRRRTIHLNPCIDFDGSFDPLLRCFGWINRWGAQNQFWGFDAATDV